MFLKHIAALFSYAPHASHVSREPKHPVQFPDSSLHRCRKKLANMQPAAGVLSKAGRKRQQGRFWMKLGLQQHA